MAVCWICEEDRHEDCAGVTWDEPGGGGEPNGSCACWESGHYPQPKEEVPVATG